MVSLNSGKNDQGSRVSALEVSVDTGTSFAQIIRGRRKPIRESGDRELLANFGNPSLMRSGFASERFDKGFDLHNS